MMNSSQEILQAAYQLPVAERAHIAEALLESLDRETAEDPGEVERAWRKEVRERSQQLSSGQVEPVPWKQVQADAESLFDGGD